MTSGPGEIDPSQSLGGERSSGASFSAAQVAAQVTFDRRELGRIFGLYGRKVAEGERRDYSIDFLKDRAVFSIFRRSSEIPIYLIEKNSPLALSQGTYNLISATVLIVRRRHGL